MRLALLRIPLVCASGLFAISALACSSGAAVPIGAPTPAPQTAGPATPGQPAPAPSATPTPLAGQTAPEYDPNATMYLLFPGFGQASRRAFDALSEIVAQHDISQVPVLVEIIRFIPSPAARGRVAATLQQLTGQQFGGDDFRGWSEWLGRHRSEFPPPERYPEWKSDMLSQIDPRFAEFLRDAAETSRIDLTEVVWGGVIPDGIPDLRNPKTIPPAEADYLAASDRVFGVSINGESRAYPLRIVNAHEMANDLLGGEPISLAW